MILPVPPSSRPSPASIPVPDLLRPLIDKLADLTEQDRELVIRAARHRRRSKVELKPVPWHVLVRSSGIVSFGGNAVEDTNAIYDG
jgi:hypothetical protein